MNRPLDPTKLAETASKSLEESLEDERNAVGDHPDVGGVVPTDDAQSAPRPE